MSETIQLKKANVPLAYNKADASLKSAIKDLVGDQVDFNQKITERVKTFDDARAIVGASANLSILLDYNGQDKDMISAQAMAKLTIIAKALNEGWAPDWTDSSEYKYYPWMKNPAGSGFSFDGYGYDGTLTAVGSRLCFKSRELAEYAGKQFQDIYNDWMSL